MSQRRAPPAHSKLNSDTTTTVVVKGPLTDTLKDDDSDDEVLLKEEEGEEKGLDPLIQKARAVKSLQLEPSDNVLNDDADVELRYQVERHKARVKHWKESPFACALVEPTWLGQRTFHKRMYGAEETAPDESGCTCCSARICPLFNAGRVGNMVVLRSSHEWVEEIDEDEETGEKYVRRYTRPRLDCVLGPYWPMLVIITYPLIFGISGWAFFSKVARGKLHPLLVFAWLVLTIGLIVALAFTGCRDPGILYRYEQPPPQNENLWRWNDQTLSYRPRNAIYDLDTAVIVEDFDHTCPWTGTAIGRKNMLAFQCFVGLVFVMLMMDVFILTGVMDYKY